MSREPESRALSVRRTVWQSGHANANGTAMTRFILAMGLLLTAGPLHARQGDAIGTLSTGRYICELPGNALGQAGLRQPDADFSVISASSYITEAGSGSYLLIGDILTMTSGPRRGERFHRISDGFLRRIGDDGTDSALRCIRSNRNNR